MSERREYTIASESNMADGYLVVLDDPTEGDLCACKAFEFSREQPPSCKHIKQARAQEAAEGGAATETDPSNFTVCEEHQRAYVRGDICSECQADEDQQGFHTGFNEQGEGYVKP